MKTLRDLILTSFFTGVMFFGLLRSLCDHELFLTTMFTVFLVIYVATTISNYDKVKNIIK